MTVMRQPRREWWAIIEHICSLLIAGQSIAEKRDCDARVQCFFSSSFGNERCAEIGLKAVIRSLTEGR